MLFLTYAVWMRLRYAHFICSSTFIFSPASAPGRIVEDTIWIWVNYSSSHRELTVRKTFECEAETVNTCIASGWTSCCDQGWNVNFLQLAHQNRPLCAAFVQFYVDAALPCKAVLLVSYLLLLGMWFNYLWELISEVSTYICTHTLIKNGAAVPTHSPD